MAQAKLDPLSDKAQKAAHLGRLANPVNASSETEKWLADLGTTFAEVWVLSKGKWIDERHVADPETLPTTVEMSMSRLGARYAIWQDGSWVLCGPGSRLRRYSSRDAAEMVAIHGA